MAGRGELGFPKTNACSLREQLARTTLRNVRLQGHTYVELREDGKRFIFFCTLCLAPCYSDNVLFDHLKGNLHNERLAVAKATLLKPNPWPFNDGVLFFHGPSKNDKQLLNSSADPVMLLGHQNGNGNELAIFTEWASTDTDCDDSSHDKCMTNGGSYDLVVPGVLHDNEISDLEVRFMGVGQIAARFFLKDEVPNGICRIWCEWLGSNQSRKGLIDDVRYLLSPSPRAEIENGEDARKKRRKSFSDPEDISESLTNQYDSSGEDSQTSNSFNSRMMLNGYDDQVLHSRFILSKTLRRELRRQQRVAAERMCDICQQKMLPGFFTYRHFMHFIFPALCTGCFSGTGINIDGDELEKPTVPLSEMFRYKIKVSDARRAWMKSPEVLQNCSTGFHFPSGSDELVQENVSPLKLLHFYR
ncbi:hypothetical protein LOK49_LG07G02245 [Camellia lanceoleosa]|uniref:Uncharacterized protein n=1 Tax=Camellia lanceoleosa TaxID=1840588 RepID=A0ACC0H573_9ERIC|nr:hypothetical protein LOK49_LG07G02245 [Camellia lanceoleosa]